MPPLLPINLYSDNVAVAAPEIMAALARVNAGPAQPYGIEAGRGTRPRQRGSSAALRHRGWTSGSGSWPRCINRS